MGELKAPRESVKHHVKGEEYTVVTITRKPLTKTKARQRVDAGSKPTAKMPAQKKDSRK
jgi:hypothetical protein